MNLAKASSSFGEEDVDGINEDSSSSSSSYRQPSNQSLGASSRLESVHKKPLFTLGVFADAQYADKENGTYGKRNKYFRDAKERLKKCLNEFSENAHALACDNAGAVWAWGDASHGKLGVALGEEEKEPPSEGSFAVRRFDPPSSTPRRVAGFGAATGLATTEESITSTFAVSVAAGVEHSVAVDAAGGAWAWGSDAYGQCGRRNGGPAPA